jgi:hypothetical protein
MAERGRKPTIDTGGRIADNRTGRLAIEAMGHRPA